MPGKAKYLMYLIMETTVFCGFIYVPKELDFNRGAVQTMTYLGDFTMGYRLLKLE